MRHTSTTDRTGVLVVADCAVVLGELLEGLRPVAVAAAGESDEASASGRCRAAGDVTALTEGFSAAFLGAAGVALVGGVLALATLVQGRDLTGGDTGRGHALT